MLIEALPGLTFARPWALLLLPVAGFFCWMLYRKVNQRSAWDTLLPAPIRQALLQRQAGDKHVGRFLLLGGAWLTGILALAGPVLESPLPATQTNQSALVIVWDMSRNMLATDLQPNRLERARLKIRDLIQIHSDSQLALIAYAGTAHPVTPLSSDMHTLTNLLVSLKPSIMPEDGQNLEAGLQLASQMISSLPPDDSRVLLITSGVEGAQLDALRNYAEDLGGRLSILGVGTTEGSPVPLAEGGFMRDAQGRILLPRLQNKSLEGIASKTGARYEQIRLDDQDLNSLVPATQRLAEAQQNAALSRNDQGHWLILLLLPLAAMGARRGWLGLVLCATLIPLPAEASFWQDLWQRPDQQAMQRMERQQPDAAASLFENRQWRAWAHYQAGDYKSAVEAYEALLSAQPDDPDHHFNHGTALAMAGDYQSALEAYEQTLTRAPEHQPARHNRDRIEALVEELAKQKGQAELQKSADADNAGPTTDSNSGAGTENESNKAPSQSPGDSQDDTSTGRTSGAEPSNSGSAGSAGALNDAAQGETTATTAQTPTADQVGSPDARDSSARTRNNEQQAALRQWLQNIPDDPAELLKRKFMHERLQQLEDQSQ